MASSFTIIVQFLALSSIVLFILSFSPASGRRLFDLKKPSTLQFGSDSTPFLKPTLPAVPAEKNEQKPPPPNSMLLTFPITFQEPKMMPIPLQQQVQANFTASYFPLPGLPSLPKFPPFPFIPTFPFGPGVGNSAGSTSPPGNP